MRTSWQTETGHLECRWSEVGHVPYQPYWMQGASDQCLGENVASSVPVFTRLSPFGGRFWYVLDSSSNSN